jgi:ribonuclease E
MIKKIIISRLNNIAAIVQKNKIQELTIINKLYQINDIYLGTVQKIFTGINAAFVKLNQHDKNGFIHVNDIKYSRKLQPVHKITESITANQILLVQILKEPTQKKGPRLTTNIHLAGQYLILMPFNNTICIANKIYDENERSYLRALGTLIKPTMMGLSFKESANGITEEAIIKDLRTLKKQWHFILKAAIHKDSPALLHKDEDIIKKIMRDSYEKNITKIIVDSKNSFKQLSHYLCKNEYLDQFKIPKLQLYQKQECILEKFNVNNTISEALKAKVELTPGAYIFIESYEALTIIDVNSGSFNKSNNMTETILKTNYLAASEIAYQLKIRNINGVIIVDFIDMKTYKDQLKLLEHFNKALKMDNARPQIIQLSELGLVELTRRRKERSLLEAFNDQKDKTLSMHLASKLSVRTYTNNHGNKNHLRINSIFFRKQFNKQLTLKIQNNKLSDAQQLHIRFFLLKKTATVPLYLYYSIINKIID